MAIDILTYALAKAYTDEAKIGGTGSVGDAVLNQSKTYTDSKAETAEINSKHYTDSIIGGEESRATNAETILQSNIENESQRASQTETNLQTSINQESQRASSAESVLQSNINSVDNKLPSIIQSVSTEKARAQNAESNLEISVTTENQRAKNAENLIDSKLTQEKNRATNAEQNLQSNIENVDGKLPAIIQSVTTEKTRAQNVESILDGKITTERNRATNAEEAVQTNLNQEIATARFQEADLLVGIGTEKSRAMAVENEIKNLVTLEVARAQNNESLVSSLVQNEAQRAILSENLISSNLVFEVNRAVLAEELLRKQIEDVNAVMTFKGSVPTKADLSNPIGQDLGATYFVESDEDEDGKTTIYMIMLDESNDKFWQFITALSIDLSGFYSKDEIDQQNIANNQTIAQNLSNAETIINQNITTESSRAQGVEGVLSLNISQETNRAIAAEQNISTSVTNENQRAVNAEGILQSNIEAENTRALNAESILNQTISAENQRALNEESILNQAISTENTRALAAESVLTTNLNLESQRADAAELLIQSNLDEEEDRAKAAELVLTQNLAAETQRALEAENDLSISVTNEESRAKSAEDNLNSLLEAEYIRALTNEQTLQTNINNEEIRAKAAESVLTTNLNLESQRATNAENDLYAVKENLANKTTTLTTSSTDVQYPTAKAVYDKITEIRTESVQYQSELKESELPTNLTALENGFEYRISDFDVTYPGVLPVKEGWAIWNKSILNWDFHLDAVNLPDGSTLYYDPTGAIAVKPSGVTTNEILDDSVIEEKLGTDVRQNYVRYENPDSNSWNIPVPAKPDAGDEFEISVLDNAENKNVILGAYDQETFEDGITSTEMVEKFGDTKQDFMVLSNKRPYLHIAKTPENPNEIDEFHFSYKEELDTERQRALAAELVLTQNLEAENQRAVNTETDLYANVARIDKYKANKIPSYQRVLAKDLVLTNDYSGAEIFFDQTQAIPTTGEIDFTDYKIIATNDAINLIDYTQNIIAPIYNNAVWQNSSIILPNDAGEIISTDEIEDWDFLYIENESLQDLDSVKDELTWTRNNDDFSFPGKVLALKTKIVDDTEVFNTIVADKIAYDDNQVLGDRLRNLPAENVWILDGEGNRITLPTAVTTFYNPAELDYSIGIPYQAGSEFEFFLDYYGSEIIYPDFLCLGGQPTLPDNTLGTALKFDFGDTQVSTRIRSHERPVVWLDETPNDSTFPNGHFLSYKDELDAANAKFTLLTNISAQNDNNLFRRSDNDGNQGLFTKKIRGFKTIYVDCDTTETTEDGTQYYPYKTINSALSNLEDGTSVYVSRGTYQEDLTITGLQDVFFFADGLEGDYSVFIDGKVSIESNIENDPIGFMNFKIDELEVTENTNDILFMNVEARNVLYSSYSYMWMYHSRISGLLKTEYALNDVAGEIELEDTYFFPLAYAEADFDGSLVFTSARNAQLVHSNGRIVIRGDSTFIGNDQNQYSIISTANDNQAYNLLFLLSGTIFDYHGRYWNINKTGTCPYIISVFTHDESNDVLNGSQLDGGLHTDQIFDYKIRNYTPDNRSLESHLDRIDELIIREPTDNTKVFARGDHVWTETLPRPQIISTINNVLSVDNDYELDARNLNIDNSAQSPILIKDRIDNLDAAKVDKAFKTGSQTIYKVLSDNNFTDDLVEEIDDHENEIVQINSKLQGLVGSVVYIGKIEQTSATLSGPTGQALLNARANAIGRLPLLTGYTLISSDLDDWWYDANVNNWMDIGRQEIPEADNNSLGIVKGSTTNLKVGIDASNEMSVNGLSDILNDKVDKAFKTGSSTIYKVLSDNNYTDADKAKVTSATGSIITNGDGTKFLNDKGQYVELTLQTIINNNTTQNNITQQNLTVANPINYIKQWKDDSGVNQNGFVFSAIGGAGTPTLNTQYSNEISMNYGLILMNFVITMPNANMSTNLVSTWVTIGTFPIILKPATAGYKVVAVSTDSTTPTNIQNLRINIGTTMTLQYFTNAAWLGGINLFINASFSKA